MNTRALPLVTLVLLGALGALPTAARSQCAPVWSSAAPQGALAGLAECSTLWDPDGTGPAPQLLVIGGEGLIGGTGTGAHLVMTWDGTQWQSLGQGPGTNGKVTHLTTFNGQLLAAGTFTGGGTDRIATWNGVAWQPLGPGLPSPPSALCEFNGILVVSLAGIPVIQLWNGTAWSILPAPPTPPTSVNALVSYQGLLCVGGNALFGGGVLCRWNGTSWLPNITAGGPIRCFALRFSLVVGGTTVLYVGGDFNQIGPVPIQPFGIASTTGGTTFSWSTVGSGLPLGGLVLPSCRGLHTRTFGLNGFQLVARTLSSTAPVMTLSGNSFVPMGTNTVNSLQHYAGSYHGTDNSPSPSSYPCLRYNGSAWVPVLGSSIDGEVRALTPSGADVIVGGTFQATGGAALDRIARWNGTTFQPLGSGVNGFSVDALLTLDSGDVVAGGQFTFAGGFSASNVARWNGSSWSPLATGCDQQVLALARMPNGDVIAGGKFSTAGGVPCSRIARWNGTAWAPLDFGLNGDVLALAVRSDGTLFAGGTFTFAGAVACSRIAQWNGTAWSPLGFGLNGDVHALAVRPNDDVIATGAFTTVFGVFNDRCARWTGSTFGAMGASSGDPSPVRAVFALPNGDVVAGRGFNFPTANPDSGISRWIGPTWTGFQSGLESLTPGAPVAVRAIAQRADGALVVGGDFGIAGGLVARGLAKLSSACPASASPYGAGCSSSAGPLVLTADTLPWIGGTFRTTTTGIAPGSLCFGIIGFTQASTPLQSLLAQGQPGCSLLASPDITMLLQQNIAGNSQSALALAQNPSLIGATFFQQSIPLEFNGTGALIAVRGSGGLAATIGTL